MATGRSYTPAKRQKIINRIDAMVADGETRKNACFKAGIAISMYHYWSHKPSLLGKEPIKASETTVIHRPKKQPKPAGLTRAALAGKLLALAQELLVEA